MSASPTLDRLRTSNPPVILQKATLPEKRTRGPLISSYYTTEWSSALYPERLYYKLVEAYSGWIYTCIDRIAKDVAMIPLKLYVYRSKQTGKIVRDTSWRQNFKALNKDIDRRYFLKNQHMDREELLDHPFLTLMARPNGSMTRFDLWYHTMVRLELSGLCGWLKLFDGLKVPRAIWPLPLTKYARLIPKISQMLELEHYTYQDGEVMQRFSPKEVFVMRYPHPASPFQGMSPLMAQTYPYDIDTFMMQQQRALYEHGAVPGLFLGTDQQLVGEQVQELREQINDQYAGAVKSGETLITHSGLKPQNLGHTSRDAQTVGIADLIKDRLITAFDLSPGKLGMVKDVNRANGEFLNETHYGECIRPKCILIEENIEQFWLPNYDEGLTCDFELPEIGDKEYRLKEREANLKLFYTTINEEREEEGKKPVPWGDRPWGPMTEVQIGGAPIAPKPSGQQEEPPIGSEEGPEMGWLNSFPGHEGRPGERGGSKPRGEEGGTGDSASKAVGGIQKALSSTAESHGFVTGKPEITDWGDSKGIEVYLWAKNSKQEINKRNYMKSEGIVGRVEMKVYNDGEHAHLSAIFLKDEHQKGGLGNDLVKGSVDSCVKDGVKRISLFADGESGVYAWSVQGFDWTKGGDRRSMSTGFSSYLKTKAGVDVRPDSFKHSWDIASYRLSDGKKIGKEYLLGYGRDYFDAEMRVGSRSPSYRIFQEYHRMRESRRG